MNTKQTITVIGAISSEVYSICENLTRGPYRLIFCGDEKQNLEANAALIKTKVLSAELEVQECMIDASWEADIIIVAAAAVNVRQIAAKIREVVNQKIVMITGSEGTLYERPHLLPATIRSEDLQQLLPNSKLVRLCFAESNADVAKHPGSNTLSAFIGGSHQVGLCAMADLLKEAGCNVIIKDDSSRQAEGNALATYR